MAGTMVKGNADGKYTATMTFQGSDKKHGKVDSKDTIVLFVNSDKTEGVSGMTCEDIELSRAFNDDYCTFTNTQSGATATYNYSCTNLDADNSKPNVKAYFDDDDQITVLVVDVNSNITQW